MKMLYIASLVTLILSCSCSGGSKSDATTDSATDSVEQWTFQADSAMTYIKEQVSFGPRVPGTDAHEACADYLVGKLRQFGVDSVSVQTGTVTAFTGDVLPLRNIYARVNGKSPKRVLLAAHWDSRPWADREEKAEDRAKAIDGANDGASGVGVILEIARMITANRPEVGVDILLTDVEDYGKTEGWGNNDETWCLGTQYWIKSNPYANDTPPAYGILLDMVGGRDAKFHREYFSQQYANQIVDKVWSCAAVSGFSDRFVNQPGGAITDDHVFINSGGIPCIDIIESMNPQTRAFNPTWHTLNDNLQNIDPQTIRIVGQVVSDVIYNEQPND